MFLKKRSYHETINNGAIVIKETIYDSAIGMKNQFVGHRLLEQTTNWSVIDLFEAMT